MKKIIIALLTLCLMACTNPDIPEGGVQSILFVGEAEAQPLVVGLGGSEGGNAWATDRWKPVRDKFIDKGYAFLAVGYFGVEGAPEQLDRISLDKIHDAILQAASGNSKVTPGKIALIGGSKGAELALIMASYYSDISCVISIVGSHAAFPALTLSASTSSWTYNGNEVPYVPASWSSVPSIIKGNLRSAFEIMMEDTTAVNKALIKVENIHGPVLCVSAREDEMWPSAEMSTLVMKRLDAHKFPYVHEHIIVEGGHMEPLDEFDRMLAFLNRNYPVVQL